MQPAAGPNEDPVLRIFAERNLLVAAWHGAPEPEHIRRVAAEARGVARRHPEGSAFLSVIVQGRPQIHDGVRAETVKAIQDATLFPLGAAHLVLLDGLAGAAVRAFLSTAMLLGKSQRPKQVFSDPQGAAAWLVRRLEPGRERWTAEAIEQLIARVR
jgi:hypothetical protein